ncbi:MAG: IS1182 family transposase, partial [Nanoarchaeota archaeon]
MSELTLFELPEPQAPVPAGPPRPEEARVLRPARQQIQWALRDLEAAVCQDHPARAIWGLLENLDLSAFYGSIKAVLDRPGRPTTDPQVLLALWLLATVEGIGSARRLARLCKEHDAYRWLCGGVPINYHMLSDFRVSHQGALDNLLTQIVASLMAAGAVTLERVAQDGMRVRASAGASSFRRQERLKECLKLARAQVERLAYEREHPDPAVSLREQRARERAARERVERVERALEYLPQAQAAKERQQETKALADRAKVTAPRTSTTDPEARVMKMPDSGFRPAYNVELATDRAGGVILGVAVTGEGTDAGQALPMEEQVVKRTGQHPGAYLMDGGFA